MIKFLVVVFFMLVVGMCHAEETTSPDGIEGTGKWVYRPDLGQMDDTLQQAVKVHAHGQYTEVDGRLYTCIKSQGLVRTTPDLKSWERVDGQDEDLTKGVNAHGICSFTLEDEKLIAIADNGGHIWIVSTEGKIRDCIDKPSGTEFANGPTHINRFYSMRQTPVPFTGVAYSEGSLWVTTGYIDDGQGDNILELSIKDGKYQWGTRAYGKRGKELGDFQRAHGISAYGKYLLVASRHNDQLFVVEITPDSLKVVTIFNLKEQQKSISQEGNILICHAMVYEGYAYCPLLDPHGGREHASCLIYKISETRPMKVIRAADEIPGVAIGGGLTFEYAGRLTPGLQDPSLSEKRRFHGVYVFSNENANGTTSTILAAHMWPGGGRQEGGLLFFELKK